MIPGGYKEITKSDLTPNRAIEFLHVPYGTHQPVDDWTITDKNFVLILPKDSIQYLTCWENGWAVNGIGRLIAKDDK